MKRILLLLLPIFTFAQVNLPSIPQPAQMPNYSSQNRQTFTPNVPQNTNPQYLKQMEMYEQDRKRVEQEEAIKTQINKDIVSDGLNINYNLPSLSNSKGTEFYRDAFDKMLNLNVENYSVKDVNFTIENAFYENKEDKAQFDQIIKNSAEFLISKMKELNYDLNSNSAKNYILYQFFAETLQLKGTNVKHLPFTYDFNDYMGINDYSKMFVTKLMKTRTGQCHSMPLFYLILAEQINAEAYLSFSPNHSYISFPDDDGKQYQIELTNGMFSTSSYISQSGYIKSEALLNNIYMQNLTKKELLSQFYVDLASGYIHKFGNDEFVDKVISKALELNPKSISANIIKMKINTQRFEYVMQQLKINPQDKKDLQNIRSYPKALEMLNDANQQFNFFNSLGYEPMSSEAYQEWLQNMKKEKTKRENLNIAKQLKGSLKMPMKN